MSSIETLDALVNRVVTDANRQHDILADTRRMSIEADVLTVDSPQSGGVESFTMSEHALGQVATDLGIPKRYFDRMRTDAPDLYRTNVHHWLYSEPKRRMIRSYVSPEQDSYAGRAWLSDRFKRLDNIEIATKLLPEFERLGQEVKFHNAYVSDERFYLRAVFPGMTREIKVGDAVEWGVQIRNSEVGGSTFAIESFVNRLICTNGMVIAKVLNARHVGRRIDSILSDEAVRADDKAFWLAARDMLRASLDEAEFDRVVDQLRETTDGPEITAPIAATERLAKTFALSDTEREAVLTQLALGGDMSRWGALNAVTAAAQTVESFDRQVELEEIGWNVAELPARQWERIAVAS